MKILKSNGVTIRLILGSDAQKYPQAVQIDAETMMDKIWNKVECGKGKKRKLTSASN